MTIIHRNPSPEQQPPRSKHHARRMICEQMLQDVVCLSYIRDKPRYMSIVVVKVKMKKSCG